MRRVITSALAVCALVGAVEAQANYTKTKFFYFNCFHFFTNVPL